MLAHREKNSLISQGWLWRGLLSSHFASRQLKVETKGHLKRADSLSCLLAPLAGLGTWKASSDRRGRDTLFEVQGLWGLLRLTAHNTQPKSTKFTEPAKNQIIKILSTAITTSLKRMFIMLCAWLLQLKHNSLQKLSPDSSQCSDKMHKIHWAS